MGNNKPHIKVTIEIDDKEIILTREDLSKESIDEFFAWYMRVVEKCKDFERLVYHFKSLQTPKKLSLLSRLKIFVRTPCKFLK